jgi:hypothetical protein
MIQISRTIVENMLINKHVVQALPIVDSNNTQLIEEIVGNQLRVIKRYPAAYDFIANVIWQIKNTGNPSSYIKDYDEDYYRINISKTTWDLYFNNCKDFIKRQSLQRQILSNFANGYVVLKGSDAIKGRYIENRRPFIISATRYYEDGSQYKEMFISKAVFSSLVTGECFKNGNEGYVSIPHHFFPRLNQIDRKDMKAIESPNPAYKMNIYGLLRNTYRKKHIKVNRAEFLENVIPEYISKVKEKIYYLNKSKVDIHADIKTALTQAEDALFGEFMVYNFFIGNKDIDLYFLNSDDEGNSKYPINTPEKELF